MKIAISGLGHVGRGLAATLEGKCDLVTYDCLDGPLPRGEFEGVAIHFICAGTPSNADGSCDTSQVEAAVSESPSGVVVIKSTVPPGTADRLSVRFDRPVLSSPEFYGEGPLAHDAWGSKGEIDFTILGGPRAEVDLVAQQLTPLLGAGHRWYFCQAVDAELIKYMENAFLATKVAFVNEFYDIAASLGASWTAVRQGWLLDPRIGTAHSVVLPDDRGFGGRCFPKDVAAIRAAARQRGVPTTVLDGVVAANRAWRSESADGPAAASPEDAGA